MLFFRNDYGEGAHPKVLDALIKTNGESTVGYGEDNYTCEARELLKNELKCQSAEVYFISGGTQANLLMISSILRPHEAVLSANTGHINVHETGAIEATGHKILSLPSRDGKVCLDALKLELQRHTDHHMVKPRLLYLSNATELGSAYTKDELLTLRRFLNAHGLLLFIDGARLASALAVPESGLSLKDLPAIADAFSVGGTKNGALFGEALVIINPALQADFPYLMKQRGALLAKGRLLGVQFKALFEDGLFFEIGAHENEMALRLKTGLNALGFEFYIDSPTNQLFPILRRDQVEKLRKHCEFEVIEPRGEDAVIRFVTSWATSEKDVDSLIGVMRAL